MTCSTSAPRMITHIRDDVDLARRQREAALRSRCDAVVARWALRDEIVLIGAGEPVSILSAGTMEMRVLIVRTLAGTHVQVTIVPNSILARDSAHQLAHLLLVRRRQPAK